MNEQSFHAEVFAVFWAVITLNLPVAAAQAASANCASLGQLPATLEVGEGLQQAIQSPVAITRLAVGDPKIADVHVNGNQAFLLTGVAPGATTLMIWTACSPNAPDHGVRQRQGHFGVDQPVAVAIG